MTRVYVTMTWDDWPEGGSFGTIVECDSINDSEALCKAEMAQARADEMSGDDEEYTPEYFLEHYGDEWHTVDNFDLDEFIDRNRRPDPLRDAAPGLLAALKLAAWDLGITDNEQGSRRGATADAVKAAIAKAGVLIHDET